MSLLGKPCVFASTGPTDRYGADHCASRDFHFSPHPGATFPYSITNATSPAFCPNGWVGARCCIWLHVHPASIPIPHPRPPARQAQRVWPVRCCFCFLFSPGAFPLWALPRFALFFPLRIIFGVGCVCVCVVGGGCRFQFPHDSSTHDPSPCMTHPRTFQVPPPESGQLPVPPGVCCHHLTCGFDGFGRF